MQAFAGTSFDSLDSYALTELPVPEPGPGQVRVRVAATALGYVDGLMAQGRYQTKPPLPYVPGGEIAGVLEAVGAGVSTLAVGDRVVTWQLGGGMADCVVVDAADVDGVPGDLPLPVAAAIAAQNFTPRMRNGGPRLVSGEPALHPAQNSTNRCGTSSAAPST